MFNKREKEFDELIRKADLMAGIEPEDTNKVVLTRLAAEGSFAANLGMILAAPDLNAWIEAVRIALEALAAKLYGSGDRPKWTKVAAAAVQIAAFVVTMIRSLKQLKK